MTTRQLATLIGAGFPLVSALDALLPQTPSYALKRTLARVKDLVVEGNSFAHALSQFPGIFPPIYVNMVRAGESSGTLEIVLERLAEITEKQQALSNRIQASLAYPVFMLFFGVVVLFIGQLQAPVTALPILAIYLATVFAALGSTMLKRGPRQDPLAANAVAAAVGAPVCLLASVLLGEAHSLPTQWVQIYPILYLAIVGSVPVRSCCCGSCACSCCCCSS